MPRLTRNLICKAIKEKTGHGVSLHNGNGYFYFYNDDASILDYTESTSVYVGYLNALNLDRWVSDFEDIISKVDMDLVEEAKRINMDQPIKVGFQR